MIRFANSRTCMCVLLVASGDHKKELPLRELRAEATVMRQFANVKLVHTFENNASSAGSAKFFFPKDTAAAVHALSATTKEGTVRAVLAPKKEAQKTFDDAKKAGKTASLMSYEQGDMYSLSLANIAAGEQFVVETEYATILPLQAGQFVLTLPSYISPKYSNDFGSGFLLGSSSSWKSQGVGDDTRISIAVHLAGDAPAAITCTDPGVCFSARSLSVEKRGSLKTDFRAHVRYTDPLTEPRAFWAPLSSALANEAPPPYDADAKMDVDKTSGAKSHANIPGAATMLSMIPAFECAEQPLAVVVLVDMSGSMFTSVKPSRAETAANAVAASLINKLKEGDHVGITTFGTNYVRNISLRPLTDDLFATLKNTVSSMFNRDMGGTELFAALRAALGDLKAYNAPGVQRCVVMLTDGDVNSNCEDMISHLRELAIPVFCLGIGSGISRDLLEHIAEASGGDAFFATESNGSTESDLVIGAMNDLMRVARAAVVFDAQILPLGPEGLALDVERFDRTPPTVVKAPPPENASFYQPEKAYTAQPFSAPKPGDLPEALAGRVPRMRSGRVLTCAMLTKTPVGAVRLTGTLYGKQISMDVRVSAATEEQFPGAALAALAGLAMHSDWLRHSSKEFYAPWMLDIALRCKVFCSLVSFVTVHPDRVDAASGKKLLQEQEDDDEEEEVEHGACTGVDYLYKFSSNKSANVLKPARMSLAASHSAFDPGERLMQTQSIDEIVFKGAPKSKSASAASMRETGSAKSKSSNNYLPSNFGFIANAASGFLRGSPASAFTSSSNVRSTHDAKKEESKMDSFSTRGGSGDYEQFLGFGGAMSPSEMWGSGGIKYGSSGATTTPDPQKIKITPAQNILSLRDRVLFVVAKQSLAGYWSPQPDLDFIFKEAYQVSTATWDVKQTTTKVLKWLKSLFGPERALAEAAIEKAEAWLKKNSA